MFIYLCVFFISYRSVLFIFHMYLSGCLLYRTCMSLVYIDHTYICLYYMSHVYFTYIALSGVSWTSIYLIDMSYVFICLVYFPYSPLDLTYIPYKSTCLSGYVYRVYHRSSCLSIKSSACLSSLPSVQVSFYPCICLIFKLFYFSLSFPYLSSLSRQISINLSIFSKNSWISIHSDLHLVNELFIKLNYHIFVHIYIYIFTSTRIHEFTNTYTYTNMKLYPPTLRIFICLYIHVYFTVCKFPFVASLFYFLNSSPWLKELAQAKRHRKIRKYREDDKGRN